MQLNMLKCKIHRATVTEADLDYTGSIAIDADLLKASGILPNEQVDIYNITNGERFTTYAIIAPGGSGAIEINGAAAHKATIGDEVIICAYAAMGEAEAKEHKPTLVFVDEENRIQNAGFSGQEEAVA
jgi:aspartate 1-decarboxylase